MSEEHKVIERLAGQARKECTPCCDVADRVMNAIRSRAATAVTGDQFELRMLTWIATVAVIIAVVVAAFTVPLYQQSANPVTEILIAALQN